QSPAGDIPRTPDGHVDLSGYWNTRGLMTMESGGPGPVAVDAADAGKAAKRVYDLLRSPERGAAQDPNAYAADVQTLGNVGGQWRSSLITAPENGKLPLTDEGRRRLEAAGAAIETANALGPEQRDDFERCIAGTGRTPLSLVPANNFRQIVQTDNIVLVYSDEGGDVRRLKLNGAPLPELLRSRYGDSIARWEGDDLVVTTSNLLPFANGSPWAAIVVGEGSRVVERLRLLSADELLYRFTVEDPALYAQPWSAEFSMRRSVSTTYEFGCHEGNYSIVNVLKAARVREQ
ncbi:MAG TPA: hypothetical protein VFV70_03110, partial [Hyphomonadaceae bacterium]|nr:hypothetical protein [Hyphomonadaceae bacterium]